MFKGVRLVVLFVCLLSSFLELTVATSNGVCKKILTTADCNAAGCFWCPDQSVCRASEPKCPVRRRSISEELQRSWRKNLGPKDLAYQQLAEDGVQNRSRNLLVELRSNLDRFGRRRLTQNDDPVLTIPIVYHNIYRTTSEFVSEKRLQAQTDQMTYDFNLLNGRGDFDTFASIDAPARIAFAIKEIKRVSTTTNSWSANDAMKFSNQGGSDAVLASTEGEVLNFWVVNLGSGLLGYAQFPGGSAATDGIVCGHQFVGGDPALFNGDSEVKGPSSSFGIGGTATHEVGHWLNLRHIWGDGNCNADDFVSDTPESDAPNYGCATSEISCNSLDMVQNFMDYSDDSCMNSFSAGQVSRIWATVGIEVINNDLVLTNNGIRKIEDFVQCTSNADCPADDGLVCNGGPIICTAGRCQQQSPPVRCGSGQACVEPSGNCISPCTEQPEQNGYVRIRFLTDNYPLESSYTLMNMNTQATVMSKTQSSMTSRGTEYVETVCIERGVDYSFTVVDSYGDGICCRYGSGLCEVTDMDNNQVLASVGNFGRTIENVISIPLTAEPSPTRSPVPSPSSSSQPSASSSSQPSASSSSQPSASSSSQPSASSSSQPSASSSPGGSPDPTPSNSPAPSQSNSNSPAPSQSNTPSNSPAPSQSNTPTQSLSNSPDPCEGVTCANGGTCAAGVCQCVGSYTPESNCNQYLDPCIVYADEGADPCVPGTCSATGYDQYECDCDETQTGYTGVACEDDVLECTFDPPVCGQNAQCTELSGADGKYSCQCLDGFAGPETNCVDIDECDEGIDECDASATCVNTVGSYECTCGGVGTPDPVTGECTDINQCALDPEICGPFADGAECQNLDDSTSSAGYQCFCKRGNRWWANSCRSCKSGCRWASQCRDCDPTENAWNYDAWVEGGAVQAFCENRQCVYPSSNIARYSWMFNDGASDTDFLNDNDFEMVKCNNPEEDEDGDQVCDDLDKCPGFDDHLDLNMNTVPDECDPCLLKPCTTDETCLVVKTSLQLRKTCVPQRGNDTPAPRMLLSVLKQDAEPMVFAGLLTEIISGILGQPSNRLRIYLDEENQYDEEFQVYTILILPGLLGGPPVTSPGTIYTQLLNAMQFQVFMNYEWGTTLSYTFDQEVLVGWCEDTNQWMEECALYQVDSVSTQNEATEDDASLSTQSGAFIVMYVVLGLVAVVSFITLGLLLKSRADMKEAGSYQAYKEGENQQAKNDDHHQPSHSSTSSSSSSSNTHFHPSPAQQNKRLSPRDGPRGLDRPTTLMASPLEMDYLIAPEDEVSRPVHIQPSPRGKANHHDGFHTDRPSSPSSVEMQPQSPSVTIEPPTLEKTTLA